DVEDISKQPGGKAAVTVFQHNKAAWAHRLVDEVFAFKKKKDTFSAIVDQSMKLTKDEAAEFMGDVDEVLATWAAKTRARATAWCAPAASGPTCHPCCRWRSRDRRRRPVAGAGRCRRSGRGRRAPRLAGSRRRPRAGGRDRAGRSRLPPGAQHLAAAGALPA